MFLHFLSSGKQPEIEHLSSLFCTTFYSTFNTLLPVFVNFLLALQMLGMILAFDFTQTLPPLAWASFWAVRVAWALDLALCVFLGAFLGAAGIVNTLLFAQTEAIETLELAHLFVITSITDKYSRRVCSRCLCYLFPPIAPCFGECKK